MLAIWAFWLGIEALAQGVPAPTPAASPAPHDAVLLRSKTLFEYRVKSPQGEGLGKIELRTCLRRYRARQETNHQIDHRQSDHGFTRLG
jgi:hypothetical protein